jgi:hypothetical protein
LQDNRARQPNYQTIGRQTTVPGNRTTKQPAARQLWQTTEVSNNRAIKQAGYQIATLIFSIYRDNTVIYNKAGIKDNLK